MSDQYIGKRLDGRYEIHELVGEGGMANVYKGKDLLEHRTIAIKILKDELSNNEELVRRFKNESRAISVLNHPNIVKVFDVSVTNKVRYIVMEYIDGITLKEYIEQRGEPLTYKETIHFVGQVLRALQHAHDKGIVHRDIKPQNIMLLEDGSVKVMDFGIARLARSESHTATDQAIGSVHYISPEQAKGEQTDLRADIYSVGITMYEMLSGKLPFQGDNAVSIAIMQISDDATPLETVNPSVPEGLVAITAKAMAKEPRQRYQSALEMLQDIEEFKRNPSIKFEYDYLTNTEPTRYMKTVGKPNNQRAAQANRSTAKKNTGKKLKKRSLLVPLVGIATLIIVLVSAILCINMFQNSGNPLFGEAETVTLPNFVDMDIEEVKVLLSKPPYDKLRLQDILYENNPDKPDGAVLSQNPSPKGVKANQKLTLTVNSASAMITIPQELIGMDRKQVTEAVQKLGIIPYIVSEEAEGQPIGKVFKTDPPVGGEIENKSDRKLTIYISGEKKDHERVVPQLVGLSSQEDAKNVLAGSDLELGAVSEEWSGDPAGSVIRQSPDVGTKAFPFSSVSIVISKGPEPAPEPPPEPVIPEIIEGDGEDLGELD